MIHYKNRFHGHRSLRYVYKNGTAIRGNLFTIKASHNPHRKTSRVAVVVSKKVLKSAVGRNRIRRRLYEMFRSELPLMKPVDIACIVTTRDVYDMPADELRVALTARFKEADLYKNPS